MNGMIVPKLVAMEILFLLICCGTVGGAPIWSSGLLKNTDALLHRESRQAPKDPWGRHGYPLQGMAMSMTTDSMMDMGGDSMSMQMYFYASADATILFKGWVTDTWAEMLGSCAAVIVFAALYEGLKLGRLLLLERMTCRSSTSPETCCAEPAETQDTDASKPSYGSMADGKNGQHKCSQKDKSPLTKSHTVQTCLHFVQVFYAYTLMLIFMTFNVYLCLSVAFGAALGYWCFAWKHRALQGYESSCHE